MFPDKTVADDEIQEAVHDSGLTVVKIERKKQ